MSVFTPSNRLQNYLSARTDVPRPHQKSAAIASLPKTDMPDLIKKLIFLGLLNLIRLTQKLIIKITKKDVLLIILVLSPIFLIEFMKETQLEI